MLIIPPTMQFRKRGPKAKGATSAPLPTGPLMVVSVGDVSFHGSHGSFTVRLNVNPGFELDDSVEFDPEQWTCRYEGGKFVGSDVGVSAPDTLSIEVMADGSEVGSDQFNYAADPSDVIDTQGRELGVVSGYPI